MIETDRTLSAPVETIFHARAALKLFHLTVVPTLAEAFRDIDKQHSDVILVDLDPLHDPEMAPLVIHITGHAPDLLDPRDYVFRIEYP